MTVKACMVDRLLLLLGLPFKLPCSSLGRVSNQTSALGSPLHGMTRLVGILCCMRDHFKTNIHSAACGTMVDDRHNRTSLWLACARLTHSTLALP
ncbi:hypothetical protein F5Y15DRAFT_338024 [Xylariaceae sp. FL0016]|nr:hypothetical protein F5Y15DRAFT_338024 [Xylariaceae sp. FL0016]